MKLQSTLHASLLIAAMLVAGAAQSATMSKADHSAAKTRISAQYKTDKAACADLKNNAKDICQVEAKGKQNVALAELQHGYSGKPADQMKLLKTRAQADYALAKEKCDDLAGNAKDVCMKEAKAVETKALVDAKAVKEVREVKTDAAQEKRDADYTVATEKCDAMAGAAKSSCIAAAKAKFGKT